MVECGWKDKMKKSCKDKIGDKGVNNVTVESLSAELVASARSTLLSFCEMAFFILFFFFFYCVIILCVDAYFSDGVCA